MAGDPSLVQWQKPIINFLPLAQPSGRWDKAKEESIYTSKFGFAQHGFKREVVDLTARNNAIAAQRTILTKRLEAAAESVAAAAANANATATTASESQERVSIADINTTAAATALAMGLTVSAEPVLTGSANFGKFAPSQNATSISRGM